MPDQWWQQDETVGPAPKAAPGGNWWEEDETVAARPAGPPAKGPNQVLRNQPAETTGQMVKGLLKRQVMRSATGGMFDTWDEARDAFFGTPERRQLEREGVAGFQPTPSQMGQMAVFAAGPAVAEALPMLGAASRVPGALEGVVPQAARLAAEHPRVVNAALGAAPGAIEGNPKAAAYGAMAGVVLGGRKARANEEAAAALAELRAATAEARAVIPKPSAPSVPAEPVPVPAEVPPRVAPAPAADAGRAAAMRHNKTMAFAKEAAQSNPKIGQKIWMELDETGAPVRVLTPDQAAAAKRQGLTTTWVKNLWASTGL